MQRVKKCCTLYLKHHDNEGDDHLRARTNEARSSGGLSGAVEDARDAICLGEQSAVDDGKAKADLQRARGGGILTN